MFQNGISQNTKCAKRDGFRREGHIYISFYHFTVNMERFPGLNFHVFHGFLRVSPQKFSHEYKCLSLIIVNEKHFWPRQCESISAKTSMVLKPQTSNPTILSLSKVYSTFPRSLLALFLPYYIANHIGESQLIG